MAIPTSSPTPLDELPSIPQLLDIDNEHERRQHQQQQRHSPLPKQQQQQHQQQQPLRQSPAQQPPKSQQPSPQHRPQQLDIVNSLEEFPSLPKKTVVTPLTAQVS